MKVVKKYEMVPPKTGETNQLFGVKYLKRHMIRDTRWTAADKTEQYEMLAKLYDKDHEFNEIKSAIEREELKKQLKDCYRQIKEKTKIIRIALEGDKQKIKNIMDQDKYMQRFFPNLSSQDLIKKLQDKTFEMQRQQNAAMFEQKKLMDEYERELIEVSYIQDDIRYRDVEPKEVEIVRKKELDLKNSQTRIRALKQVEEAYYKIIDMMKNDAIFYDHVLDALKEDLDEQEILIQKAILIRKPAIEEHAALTKEINDIENNTKFQAISRMRHILAKRDEIKKSHSKMFKLVRRDDDFEVDPTRYVLDTESIKDLKIKLDDVEPQIKDLQVTTGACDPNDIIARIERQQVDSEKMLSEIKEAENEREILLNKLDHALAIEEQLKYNLTDDEIEQIKDMDRLKLEINQKEGKTEELKVKIVQVQSQIMLFRAAFQHLNEVLNDIGKPLSPSKKERNSFMATPLVNFGAVFKHLEPPDQCEDDVGKLIEAVGKKVELVMKDYEKGLEKEKNDDELWEKRVKEAKDEQEAELVKKLRQKVKREQIVHKSKDRHTAIVNQRKISFNQPAIEDTGTDNFTRTDPTVLTRSQIKENSAKLVEKMSKRED